MDDVCAAVVTCCNPLSVLLPYELDEKTLRGDHNAYREPGSSPETGDSAAQAAGRGFQVVNTGRGQQQEGKKLQGSTQAAVVRSVSDPQDLGLALSAQPA